MIGLKFLLNNRVIASVSNRDRNIISATVSGDIIGPELAAANMIAGYYGDKHDTTHRIWLDDVEITDQDEIEIQFSDDISTIGRGLSIEEHAKLHANDDEPAEEEGEDIHDWLSHQPKARKCFSFELTAPNGDLIKIKSTENDFIFTFGVMWKWTNPDEISVHLSTTSLEDMKRQKPGVDHINIKLSLGQGVKFRVR
jgi:hypothetical protein